MKFQQLTKVERHMLSALRKQGLSNAQIAKALGRHRSTIGRELSRNRCWVTDGCYRPSKAQRRTKARRRRSRRNKRLKPEDFIIVDDVAQSGMESRKNRRISQETSLQNRQP